MRFANQAPRTLLRKCMPTALNRSPNHRCIGIPKCHSCSQTVDTGSESPHIYLGGAEQKPLSPPSDPLSLRPILSRQSSCRGQPASLTSTVSPRRFSAGDAATGVELR